MKTPKNILLALVCAAFVAVAAFAYHQYRELLALRAQLADGNAAMLKSELADARKAVRDLENRLAAARGRRGPGEGAEGGATEGAAAAAGRRGGRFGAFAAVAATPEFQKLQAIQARGRIVQTYAPLFKSLNLSPEQLQQFEGLLADKQQAVMDVMQAAREQGINPRTDPDGYRTLVNQAISQTDATIQQAIGDAGYQTYQQYQQTLPERNTVNSLQQALSYTQTPLTDDQANQMIGLLQQNQPQRAGNGTAGTSNGGEGGLGLMQLMNGGGTARVTDEAITQASGVLSSPQISALQQIQQQQQAQQQMQQMMRASFQNGNGGAAPSGTAAPPPGGKG